MNTDQSYDQVYILARPDGEEMAELTRQQFEAEGVKTVVSLSSETDLRREDLGGSIIMFVPSRQLIQEGLLNEIKSIRYSDVEKGVRRLVPIVYGDITDIEVKKALGGALLLIIQIQCLELLRTYLLRQREWLNTIKLLLILKKKEMFFRGKLGFRFFIKFSCNKRRRVFYHSVIIKKLFNNFFVLV